jgi:hypothetical protein
MTEFELELMGRLHEANLRVAHAAEAAELEKARPFMLLRPRMFPDGNQWCALYGENIQEGVAGFGDTPAKAAVQFDIEWLNARCAVKASALPSATLADFGYAPGVYAFHCLDCDQEDLGDKRSIRCKSCAEKALADQNRSAV